MLDGKPVEGATITFTPATGGTAVASGISDNGGSFRLSTVVPGFGAVVGANAGDYAVSVLKVAASSSPAASSDPGYVAPASQESPEKVNYIVPEPYSKPKTSGLRATVKPGRNEGDPFVFKLDGGFVGAKP